MAGIAAADEYASQIAACEANGDWLRVVELLAEVGGVALKGQAPLGARTSHACWGVQVRALKQELPWKALEGAVRVCANNRQGQKAAGILEGAQAYAEVSPATLLAVFSALLQESQADAALRLLQVRSLLSQCGAPRF